jgi:hypothetical protein
VRRLAVFTAPTLVGALALLLLNDLYLKAQYGNWLTGKLSDFAGLLLVALIACAFCPSGTKRALAAVGLVFAFWKSEYSQPLIDFVNALSVWQIGRVVDYTDLLALLVLPLAARASRSRASRHADPELLRRLAALPLLLVTVLAITGTSSLPYSRTMRIDDTLPGPAVPMATIETLFAETLEREGYVCERAPRMQCRKDGLLACLGPEPGRERAWVYVEGPTDRGWMAPKTGRAKRKDVDEVIEALRLALSARLAVLPDERNFRDGGPAFDEAAVACFG